MSRHMHPAFHVNKQTRGWTVLIQVVERANVQKSRGTPPKKFRRFLFTDSEGNKVSAVMYENDIRYFHNLLLPYKRYYISNASVTALAHMFRVSNYEYSWIINNTTLVEEHVESVVPTLPCTFDLTKFADLYKFADAETVHNIKAIVVHVFPPKERGLEFSTSRDIVIVNEEKIPMILTLWNEFDENDGNTLASMIDSTPMIIAMRLKVTTFNNLSLTTRMSSCILIDPPLSQDMMLKQWYNENKDVIKQLLDLKSYKDPNRLLPPPMEDSIISIEKTLNCMQNLKAVWIKAKQELAPGQSNLWYTACKNCHKSVNADLEWEFKCPSCKEEAKVKVRSRMGINLTDNTGTLNVVMFSPDIEKLIPFTPLQLKEADDNETPLHYQVAESISKHSIICFVRCYDKDFNGQVTRRHNVVHSYTSDEISQLAIDDTILNDPQLPVTPFAQNKSQQNEDQLFTPTTKKVLDEISQPCLSVITSSSSSSGLKRNLFSFYSNETEQNMPSTTVLHPSVESVVNQEAQQIQGEASPPKKNRDKMKLN